VCSANGEITTRIGQLGVHGQETKNAHAFYGTNSRLDEIHAAMLRVKLPHLDTRNRRRREIARHYDERLRGHVRVPICDPRREAVYHQYVIRTPQRDALRAHLSAEGIGSGVHFPTPIHRQAAWLRAIGPAPSLPTAERAANEVLSLPVHPDLTDTEVGRVANAVCAFFS